jgi:hypothetical protein
VIADPSAVVPAPGQLSVFVLSANRTLRERRYNGTSWEWIAHDGARRRLRDFGTAGDRLAAMVKTTARQRCSLPQRRN